MVRSAAQASFVRCICGVDKRQESSEDACRPCDRSAAASASSRRAGRHETSIDGGGEQAHRSLKQRGSPPLESRGSKHPPQPRRPQPLHPPSRRAGPRGVAAPSPAFSSRKVSQITHFNLGTCIRRPDRCWGALAGLCACDGVAGALATWGANCAGTAPGLLREPRREHTYIGCAARHHTDWIGASCRQQSEARPDRLAPTLAAAAPHARCCEC
eukprot:COSAG02_NODE_139_length_34376_cov_233.853663_34_plen_214_part_00